MTSRSLRLRLPKDVLQRGPVWHSICYTMGSGQYPGGSESYTGDQEPRLLIRCKDGTCQRVTFGVPKLAELSQEERDAAAAFLAQRARIKGLVRGRQ